MAGTSGGAKRGLSIKILYMVRISDGLRSWHPRVGRGFNKDESGHDPLAMLLPGTGWIPLRWNLIRFRQRHPNKALDHR
jgi:hypothetical protein